MAAFSFWAYLLNPGTIATTECDGYIYFDLRAGNVSIGASGYSGKAYGLDGQLVTVSGKHETANCYYVYQTTESYISAQVALYEADPSSITAPTVETAAEQVYFQDYGDLSDTTNGFIDESDINTVIDAWDTAASNGGRVATANRISITNDSTIDLTIDNIWSSYSYKSQSRNTGGIGVSMPASGGATMIRLKGQNRLENLFYGGSSRTSTSTLKITSSDGDGDKNGALVAGNLEKNGSKNFYDSVIGGSDNTYENTVGLEFAGGTIWAGSSTYDDCTTIGAGGNGYGAVKISGGVVTAVSASTGATIGGGIGYSSAGGAGLVNITGGEIYAYNYGYKKSGENFVPSAAIGGGSSYRSLGSMGTVNISGGKVYAWALGGAALGGGGSNAMNGGSANITITGGEVTAISANGLDNAGTTVAAGNGIGGGTSNTKLGGNATLTISGDETVVKTGSVGGGKGDGNVGNATVTITGGTIQGQFLMEGDGSSFTMSGGTIDNGDAGDEYVFNQVNGGAVHIEGGPATLSGGVIQNVSAVNGGAVYVDGGDFTMKSGTIQNATASGVGGAIYVNNGNVIIGIEEDYEEHAHPIIKSNTATNNGGGMAIFGGEVRLYCGSITQNMSLKNQASNNLIQEGGTFVIEGDHSTIGAGILIGDGATFIDDRKGTFVLTYHAIYTDTVTGEKIDTTTNEEVAVNASGFRLPTEATVVSYNQLFDRQDEGLNLAGWSFYEDTDEGFLIAGTRFNVTESMDLYAVYDVDKANDYKITIPAKVTAEVKPSGSGSGEFQISGELKNFDPTAHVGVTISSKNNFALKTEDEESIKYTAKVDDTVLENGSTVATFSNKNQETRTVDLTLENKLYTPGNYRDILTFNVEVVED